MSLRIILNLFVDNPLAAIIALLISGGILFGLIGGLTGIEFFLVNWKTLVGLGFLTLIIVLAWEFLREGY